MTINFFTKDALAGACSNDLSQRGKFDGASSQSQKDTRTITMTIVTWFGTWGYCEYYNYRLPTEAELCKISCETRAQAPILAEKFQLYLPLTKSLQAGLLLATRWQVT